MADHIQFCERYLIETNQEHCEKCKFDGAYRLSLVGKRMEKQKNGNIVYGSTCNYQSNLQQELKRCCNGKAQPISTIYCKLFRTTRELSSCILCNRHSACQRNYAGKIIVYGFPSLYGGAQTELHHQILAWDRMNLDIQIIPSSAGYQAEPLYNDMCALGVLVHNYNDFSIINDGDIVINFCADEFLTNLDKIYARTKNTVFVNCMTWLFDKEKKRITEGKLKALLYQNDLVRQKNQPELEKLANGTKPKFLTFKPYFAAAQFPFITNRNSEIFGCGRISRQDADKYAKNTLHIYEYFVAPKLKSAIFLGFDERSEEKIGKPFWWIRTARDHTQCSQRDFYRHCEIVLQPTDTTENWPRVGLEAMSSGSVLIVDNRGGWQQMVEHGKTGWLCDNERDFIYYASKMAFEPNMRSDMAHAARERCEKLSSLESSIESWKHVFEEIRK